MPQDTGASRPMNSNSARFSRNFSQLFAGQLFKRIELGARKLPPVSSGIQQDSDLAAVWGWGRFLHKAQDASVALGSPQIGTFGTCDALRTVEHIRTICQIYHRGNRAIPSSSLEDICNCARLFLRATCEGFTNAITGTAALAVSAPRYAKLLPAVIPNMAAGDELPAAVIRSLRAISSPLSQDRRDAIGWPWFLDSGWKAFSPECGPTALILEALVSIEPFYRSSKSAALPELIWLMDASSNYLCSRFEDGYHAEVEELVICMSALGIYGERATPSSELTRRRAAVVRTKHLVLLEDTFKALASSAALTTLRLRSPSEPSFNDPLRLNRLNDAGFDIFLHGPLLNAFLSSPTPSIRDLAANALRRALNRLKVAIERGESISTHWLAAVIEAVPTTLDVALSPDQPLPEYHRLVTVPDNRVTFLVISDTQFGRDSTAHRSPFSDGPDSFDEVQPATFDQLISEAADRLTPKSLVQSTWSGLLHLGDVVCKGDYMGQERIAIHALRSSADVLGLPAGNIVIAPGNHDVVRSGLAKDLPIALAKINSAPTPDSANIEKALVTLIRQSVFQQILPDFGLTSFRDMYSLLLERRIYPSDGGVEIVSFLAPRLSVHIVSLWPVLRYNIDHSVPKKHERQQYGLDPKARDDVRTFLTTAQPEDIVIVLSHVPAKHLGSWSQKDADCDQWMGAPAGEGIQKFLEYVSYPAPNALNHPVIHLILSGHMQQEPLLARTHEVMSYTAGAFHIHSGISSGAFAARLVIDEGALRIDTASLSPSRKGTDDSNARALPSIIAVGDTTLNFSTHDHDVVATYDSEAPEFIGATNVAGKYIELEAVRAQFSAQLTERFGGADIQVLDVGAGAGRDSAFFLSQGFRVAAVEGARRLAKWLRERPEACDRLSVFEVNLLDCAAVTAALEDQTFHGIWMCATLLHIPCSLDVNGTQQRSTLVDSELVTLLTKHLRKSGVLYLDNKLGSGAHFKERGTVLQKRWFRYRQPHELQDLISTAGLRRINGDWYNGTNGFDAWTWILAESV
jgi:calcineurin-like phosphoesterase family protein